MFVENPGEAPARVVFSGAGQSRRLPPEEPWPALPLATWGTGQRPTALDLRLLARAVWPDAPDLPALAQRTALPLEDPDPWVRAEALGQLLLRALREASSWPLAARKALAQGLPPGWRLPLPRPQTRPRPPRRLDAALQRLIEQGLAPRPSQRAYAQRVAQALEAGETVLLEAGPGTGKTFGYLIPLLLILNQGGRAVVATRTRALQDQLWKKDLPWLEEHLGLRVERALLKGRENYLCFRGLVEMETQLIPEDVLFPLKVLALRSGDLDEIGFLEGSRLREELRDRPWRCSGQRCREWARCPSRRAREAARAAHLVVVNHALLGADLATENALLGPYDYLVVDEAHALPHALREALGLEIGPGHWPPLLAELRRLDFPEKVPIGSLIEKTDRAHQEFWDWAKTILPPGRTRLSPEIVDRLAHRAGPLIQALENLIQAIKLAAEEIPASELLPSLLGYKTDLERIFSPGPGEWVRWSNREEASLGLTPLDLAEILQEKLWPKVRAAVLTSATLAVGGNPQFLLSRLGLPPEVPFQAWPSPFSYARVRVAIMAGLPEPDDPGYAPGLAEILRRVVQQVPAKIMVLFTARLALAAVHSLLEGIPHLAQGWDGEGDQLLRRFRAMPPPAILLGLESFWEGVDLPGADLEVLVVARLPFPHPAEPILEAEAERLRAQGKNEFRELFLPLALLKLRQGLGRLVRTPTDRGLILITDPRLTSRPYRMAFLKALPGAPQIIHQPADLDVVLGEVFR